ncbi:hypothetical protein JCM11251_000025 [Rhodosporidiobolus azoricus]
MFGLPERLVSDRDKLFTSRFWRAHEERAGVALQMSTAFHPETDGRSERTNKTYGINAAVNQSTGYTPFNLVLRYTPTLLPLPSSPPSSLPAVEALLEERKSKVSEARNALAAVKVRQAEQANRRRGADPEFKVGDLVMLFPRWDGPYPVEVAFPETSTYRLSLPPSDRAHPTFHLSKLKRYIPNDASLHANRKQPRPEPIDVEGEKEFKVEAIVDEKGQGTRRCFPVKREGYPDSDNTWEALLNLKDTAALDLWERRGELG